MVGIWKGDAGVGESRKVEKKVGGASERVLIKECMLIVAQFSKYQLLCEGYMRARSYAPAGLLSAEALRT